MNSEESELATLVSLLHNAISQSDHLKQMSRTWTEIGIGESQRQKRREQMLTHVTELIEEMATEELQLKEKLESSLQTNIQDLMKLYKLLSLKEEPMPDDTEMSLYQRETLVRSRVDALNKTKFERQKRLKRLIEMESSMCVNIGEMSQLAGKYRSDSVPSEEDLQRYRSRVEDIEFTVNERRAIFQDLYGKVQKIFEDIGDKPYGYFALITPRENKGLPVLTKGEMKVMQDSYEHIVKDAAQLEEEARDLRQKIESLWNRLDIPIDEQRSFTQANPGYTLEVISRLRDELIRLDTLKEENMRLFVDRTTAELHMVWNKCMYGDRQRQEFVPAFTFSCNDEVLGDLESELDRMNGFYRDNSEIYQKIEKREEMWKKFKDLLERNNDPTRLFNTRGGQLLKDQQMQKQVRKDLVKIEKELISELKQWEEDCERHFIVQDSRYLDTVKSQWEETDKKKQTEKVKRQKEKEETTMMEMTYGSKPSTPIKKIMKRPAASPLTVPAKIRKVGQSPCVSSTSTRSATRPPRSARSTRNAKTPMRTPQKRVQESKSRRILKDRNFQSTSSTSSTDTNSESFFSQINGSLASTGTYTDFQCDLNANKCPRSSVIPKTSSMTQLS